MTWTPIHISDLNPYYFPSCLPQAGHIGFLDLLYRHLSKVWITCPRIPLFLLARALRELGVIFGRQQWNSNQDAVKVGVGCQVLVQLIHVVADLLAHFVDVGLLLHLISFTFSESWVRCVQLCCEGQDYFCNLPVQLRWEAEEDGMGMHRSSSLALQIPVVLMFPISSVSYSAFLPDCWSCWSTMTS